MVSNDVNVFIDCDRATFEKIVAEAMVVGAPISNNGSDGNRACIQNVRLFLSVKDSDKVLVSMHDRFFHRTLLRLETDNSAIGR